MASKKHADLIRAWLDGAEIQYRHKNNPWLDCSNPQWCETTEYRIKPTNKSPGQVYAEEAYPNLPWTEISFNTKNCFERGALAVIRAYEQGMFDENCNC